jgi:cytoskeletal protein CcmA (bactofilin family)
VLTVSEHGRIEGDVRVPNVFLNGAVTGDVRCEERIELAAKASVNGDVYYNLIEMAMGAEVNGSLLHQTDTSSPGDSAGYESAAMSTGSDRNT